MNNAVMYLEARGSDSNKCNIDSNKERGSSFRKPINSPSAKKVKIDIEEILSGHTPSEKRARQCQIKHLFFDRMNVKDIENEIREAYGNAKQIGSPQFDGVDIRIKLQGNIEK